MTKIEMRKVVYYVGIAYLVGILFGSLVAYLILSQEMIDKKTFSYNPHATRNPKVIHQVIKSDSGGFNYKVERFHNTLRERTKVMRGFHGCITSAQTLLKGFEIYYNWVRNHQSLESSTPSELACPQVSIQGKNKWLDIINRGYDGL